MKLNAKYHFCLFPEKKKIIWAYIILSVERKHIIYKYANNHEICQKIIIQNEKYENIEKSFCHWRWKWRVRSLEMQKLWTLGCYGNNKKTSSSKFSASQKIYIDNWSTLLNLMRTKFLYNNVFILCVYCKRDVRLCQKFYLKMLKI